MLELFNRYSHGLAVIPLVLALRRNGCLDELVGMQSFGVDDLVQRFGGNTGALAVTMDALAGLGWLDADEGGRYRPTPALQDYRSVPDDAQSLCRFHFEGAVQGEQLDELRSWLDRSAQGWSQPGTLVADLLDGLIALPLLLELRTQHCLQPAGPEGGLQVLLPVPMAHRVVSQWLDAKGWGAAQPDGGFLLNRAGSYLAERIMNVGVAASYRPMCDMASELLFGRFDAVFALDEEGHERHVDRTLNVQGSGFQHDKYFQALSETIAPLFDDEDFARQPRYIADMGCGDGALLRRLYEFVCRHTRRGAAMDSHPLTLVAIDFNQKSLDETARNLQGLPCIALRGDVGRPEDLPALLAAHGVSDLSSILHVRSFLDHDRPYRAPEDREAADARAHHGHTGSYVDRDGKLLPAGDVVQSTVEHLRRWRAIAGPHGLAVLEVHALPPALSRRHLDESESLHFDLLHGLSRQYLLPAHVFLACAAEARLGVAAGPRRFPRNLPFTRITLARFVTAGHEIRQAVAVDAPSLAALGWPSVPASALEVEHEMHGHPGLQFVLLAGKDIAAALYLRRQGAAVVVHALRAGADRAHAAALLDFAERYFGLHSPPVGIEGLAARKDALYGEPVPGSVPAVHAASRAARGHDGDGANVPDPGPADAELGDYALARTVWHLQRMGLFGRGGEPCPDVATLCARGRVLERYSRWLGALLYRMEQTGWLEREGGLLRLSPRIDAGESLPDPAGFLDDFGARHPQALAMARLVHRCVEACADIVTGRVDIADVVFADGRMDLFAGISQGDAVSEHLNRLVADAAAAAVAKLQEGGRGQAVPAAVHVVEIGGGTAVATLPVLQALEPLAPGVSYCFTDVSHAFLRNAALRIGPRHPWATTARLDIEADLEAQGFAPHSFDVVIAANVLHDTRRIEHSLGQVARLLKPGGLLLINEYTAHRDCLLLSGGFLHGYWLFDDAHARQPHCCLLSMQQWREALALAGFRVCSEHALPVQADGGMSVQGVFVCEAPAAPDTVAAQVDDVLRSILGPERHAALPSNRPLMESGVDSIELVELKSALNERFAVRLTPTFLFQHETRDKIVRALAGARPVPTAAMPAPIPTSTPASTPATPPRSPSQTQPVSVPGGQAVAIVGIACRLPGGVRSPADFWQLLDRGICALGPLPDGRWAWPDDIDLDGAHAGIAKGGYLERIDTFDPLFFRISPLEAELMDPQQRLMLELSWEALEDAGRAPSSLAGRPVGVFVGACHADFRDVLAEAVEWADAHVGTGSANAMLANRLSYFYDFKGPSVAVDTACSSSLVALHDAVAALQRGDCEQALVGAVNLMCSPTNTIAYHRAGMLSREGGCRPFDAAADGYVRGEGGVMLLIKPLALALADRDRIHGLVAGVALGHGGQAGSLTAPKPDAQAEVIERAWRRAGIAADAVGYVEAHGTGTPLGDPIEVTGLLAAMKRLHERDGLPWTGQARCALGSVKSNVGHLEGAAGLAGLLKAVLAARHGRIPRTVNFERLNPHIDLHGSPLFVAAEAVPWHRTTDGAGQVRPRCAAVSSFGFGGSNAHAVVSEYLPAGQAQAAPEEVADTGPQVLALSARTPVQLRQMAEQLRQYLAPAADGDADTATVLARLLHESTGLAAASLADLEWKDLDWGDAQFQRLREAVDEALQLRLDPRVLIDCPSFADLVRHVEALRGQAVGALHPGGDAPAALADVACTLQTGRQALPHRLAVVAATTVEAAQALQRYLDGVPDAPPGAHWQAGQAAAADGAGPRDLAPAWSADLSALARLWCCGARVDWQRLRDVSGPSPHPVSLPTYPFAQTRLWPTVGRRQPPTLLAAPTPPGGTHWSTHFASDQPLLADHRIGGEAVLPAAAHMCILLEAALRHWPGRPLLAYDLAFLQRAVDTGHGVRIEASMQPAGAALAGRTAGAADAELPFAQGLFEPLDSPLAATHGLAPPPGQGRALGAAEFYDALAGIGHAYGPALRCVRELRLGESAGRMAAFASVECAGTGRRCPPAAVLDGILQVALALELERRRAAGLPQPAGGVLPVSIDRLELRGLLSDRLTVRASLSATASPELARHDLEVFDERGQLVLALTGLALRAAPAPARSADWRDLVPRWQPVQPPLPTDWPGDGCGVLVLGGLPSQRDAILAALPSARWAAGDDAAGLAGDLHADRYSGLIWIAPHDPGSPEAAVLACWRLLKTLLDDGWAGRPLDLMVITCAARAVGRADTPVRADAAAVHGLIGSLAKEQPEWRVRLLDLEAGAAGSNAADSWPRNGLAMPPDAQGDAWCHRGGQWYRQRLLACVHAPGPVATPWRRGGTYVVIGGAGGLGVALSEHLLREHAVQMVWVGRRPPDDRITRDIERLGRLGPAPCYLQADAVDPGSLSAVRDEVRRRFGAVHGLIHSPIVLADQSIAQMDEARFLEGMRAKSATAMALAQAFEGEALDFVVFFSSVQSFWKAPGQSNYAAGCLFQDAYAAWLRSRWACPVRVAHWGYWGTVGVVASSAQRQRMAGLGFGSIEPAEGLRALERLLAGPFDEMAMVRGSGRPQPYDDAMVSGAVLHAMPTVLGMPDPASLPPARAVAPVLREWPEACDRLMAQLLLVQLKEAGMQARLPALQACAGDLPWPLDVWMRHGAERLQALGIAGPPPDPAQAWTEWDRLRANWPAEDARGGRLALVQHALRALPAVLKGECTPMEALFGEDALPWVESFYRSDPVAAFFNQAQADAVARFMEARLGADPGARVRILEIGAGTGATTDAVLHALVPWQAAIDEYTCTDLSPGFVRLARDRYGDRPFVRTALLDIERPLDAQGMACGTYDLVLATNVLHAVADLRATLTHAKSALKRGGWLVLNELSAHTMTLHLTFGLLEGWWRHRDGLRLAGSPVLDAGAWSRVLREQGYGPPACPVASAHGLGQQLLVTASDGLITRESAAPPFAPPGTSLRDDLSAPHVVAPQLPAAGAAVEPPADPGDLAMKRDLQPRHALSATTDADEPVAPATGRRGLHGQMRALIHEAVAAVLKIPTSDIEDRQSFANYGVDSIVGVRMIGHIGRLCGLKLPTTLLFDHPSVERLAAHLAGRYGETLPAPAGLPAMQPATGLRQAAVAVPPDPHAPVARSRRLILDGPGQPEDLRTAEVTMGPLRAGQVRIAVRAFSLNFGDLLCVQGLYPTMPAYPFTPGLELSGVVLAVGDGVRGLQPGEEVLALTGDEMGAHASLVDCDPVRVFRKPAALTHEMACSMPVVALTAIEALRRAQPKRGELVLIQSAAGGVGLAAVQLALDAGLEVYATAGSPSKLDHLRRYGVQHLIDYRTHDFEAEVSRLTGGRGVDLVLNTLAGEALQKGMRCLAPGGRYVEIAMTALKSARSVDLSMLADNQSFISLDLRRGVLGDASRLASLFGEFLALVERGVLRPHVDSVVAFDDIASAYGRLASRSNIGKVVVSLAPEGAAPAASARAVPRSSQQPARAAVQPALLPAVPEPIAIIGISGRFGAADSLHELWDSLAQGRELVEPVSRWDVDSLRKSADSPAVACHRGSFLRDIDAFDPLFFNMSGIEATYTDPQQRLLLEQAWLALEDAGHAGSAIDGRRCGVYVGCGAGDYDRLFDHDPPPQAYWGNEASIVPARIAYFLNFKGPAIAVDTACSSSLAAIHLACRGLWAGEVEMALAGGVFVQCTPALYKSAGRAGMLSPSGRCHSFDDRADGFVPGEGVGVVVLKRLRDALRDGDHIDAVIRGSGMNQDGTTNGITAPSALSQYALERQVYEEFGIHADEITMVEAHGTGTPLGDPIEFDGLTQAFRRDTERRGYCALGSVKTNLGHLVYAAGLAGVAKVVLALRHGQVPPSLHFGTPNPRLDLQASPFFVNTELRDWPAPVGRPRCAAVSSFGMSGTNVHLVLTDPPSPGPRAVPVEPGHLVVLSAQSAAQRRQMVARLLECCERQTGLDAADVARTLALGRRHLAFRFACVAEDLADLRSRLAAGLAVGAGVAPVAGESASLDAAAQAKRLRHARLSVQAVLAARDPRERQEHLGDLAELFVNGCDIDFATLYRDTGARLVSLPGYPFLRERWWVPARRAPGGAESALHPLVHANASTLGVTAYTSTLAAQAWQLRDHVVAGRPILSAAAQIEIAHEAAARSLAGIGGCALAATQPPRSIVLHDLVWVRPGTAGADGWLPLRTVLRGRPEAQAALFEIHGADHLLCKGGAQLRGTSPAPRLDLQPWLTATAGHVVLDAAACRQRFAAQGFDYGAAYRGLHEARTGRLADGTPFVVGRLRLPDEAGGAGHWLHPALVDAMLQATLLMPDAHARDNGPALPFTLDRLESFGPLAAHGQVLCRPGAQQGLDLELCDADGQVCLRLAGFVTRAAPLQPAPGAKAATAARHDQAALLVPTWYPVEAEAPAASPAGQLLVVGADGPLPEGASSVRDVDTLSSSPGLDDEVSHVVWIVPPVALGAHADMSMPAVQRQPALAAFRLVQHLLAAGRAGRPLVLTVLTRDGCALRPGDPASPAHAAVHGVIGAAAKEQPDWSVRLFDLPGHAEGRPSLSELLAAPAAALGQASAWRDGRWWRARLVAEAPDLLAPPSHPWRRGAVCVVVGGAGALGQVLSRALVERCGAQMVWLGRRAEDASIREAIAELAGLGPAPMYLQADATDPQRFAAACREARDRFGRIDCLVLATADLRDGSLESMTESDFGAVLAAKLDPCVHLARLPVDERPEQVLVFSSLSGIAMPAGQANYAAGCAFQSAFALQLAREWHGRVRVIDWGFWGSAGLAATPAYRTRLEGAGFASIEPADGMAALDHLLSGGRPQLGFARFSRPLRFPGLAIDGAALGWPVAPVAPAAPVSALGVLDDLQRRVAGLLGVEARHLSSQKPFGEALLAEFGIDSLQSAELRNILRSEHGVTVTVQQVMGEKVASLAALIREQVLLRQVSVRSEVVTQDRETFVL